MKQPFDQVFQVVFWYTDGILEPKELEQRKMILQLMYPNAQIGCFSLPAGIVVTDLRDKYINPMKSALHGWGDSVVYFVDISPVTSIEDAKMLAKRLFRQGLRVLMTKSPSEMSMPVGAPHPGQIQIAFESSGETSFTNLIQINDV